MTCKLSNIEGSSDEHWRKKVGPFPDLRVLSLRMGHTNLLCIISILGTNSYVHVSQYKLAEEASPVDVEKSSMSYFFSLGWAWAAVSTFCSI